MIQLDDHLLEEVEVEGALSSETQASHPTGSEPYSRAGCNGVNSSLSSFSTEL